MATPEQQRHVNVAGLKAALEGDGFEIVLDARILLLVRKETESTVYNSGKVLIKTADKHAAKAAYAALRPHLEQHWS